MPRIEFLRDDDRSDSWLVVVGGVPQSAVDLDDPTSLAFEYMSLMAHVIDVRCPRPAPLRTLHVGGAGLAMARWVAVTRPRSRQLVFEPDAELTAAVRERLPLPRGAAVRVRPVDGRSGIATRGDGSTDLLLLDAFADGLVPPSLTTREWVAEVARVLAPGGTYVVNVADGPPLRFARRVAATVLETFPGSLLLAEPSTLRGRRIGNLVLAATADPDGFDIAELGRAVAGRSFPARLLPPAELAAWVGGARPLTDAEVGAAPALGDSVSAPPPDGGWRVPRI